MPRYIFKFGQLRPGNAERLFLSFESTIQHFGKVDMDLYTCVDFGSVEADNPAQACETLFAAYNGDDKPAGYHGRSMSVSDIVCLKERWAASETVWFCDTFGFKEVEQKWAES